MKDLDETIQAALDRLGGTRAVAHGGSGHNLQAAQKEAKAGLVSGSAKARQLISKMKQKRATVSVLV